MMSKKPSTVQLVWGVALAAAGVGLFFRFPEVIPRLLEKYGAFAAMRYFVYFVCYLAAVVLIIGGARKIYAYYRASNGGGSDR
jgi:hypothetical protein